MKNPSDDLHQFLKKLRQDQKAATENAKYLMPTEFPTVMAAPSQPPRETGASNMIHANPAEVVSAAPEIIAHALGIHERRPHPLAEHLSGSPLSSVAYACGLRVRPQLAHEPNQAVLGRGLGTSEFQDALAESVRQIIRRGFDANARHRAFTAIVPCRDFREQGLPTAPDALELVETNELSEVQERPVSLPSGAPAVKLRTFGRIVEVSRQLIVDDQAGLIAALLATPGPAAARLEARIAYAALEGNPNLDDAGPVFHGDHGNILAESLDATQLAAGVAMLAKQADSIDEPGDLQPAHLVTSADLAVGASKLLRECGLDDQIRLTASARLPAARWYLLADPEQHPVVGILQLERSASPLSITPRKRSLSDSVAYRITIDTGAVLLGRTGVVRGGA